MAKQPSYEELEQRCRKLETKLKLLSDRQAASSKVDRETDAVQSSDDPDTVNLGQLAVDTLLDNIDDGIVMVDIQTKHLAALNSSICHMLGYSKEELLKLGVADIHPQSHLSRVIDAIEKQLSGDTPLAQEIPMLCKDGTIFYADVHSSPIELAGKGFLLGTFRDVTKRKRIEAALRESEEKYRALIMQSADCLLLHDLESNIVDVNPSACKTYGYSREELLGMKVSELDPDYAEREDEGSFWERFRLNEPYRFEARQHRKDGTIFPVEVTVTKILIRGKTHVMGLCRDITERKEAEEALRQSEEIHRSLMNNISMGVAMISSSMEISTLNRQMKAWFPWIDVSERPLCYRSFNDPPKDEICSYCPTCKTLSDGQVHESVTDTPAGEKTLHFRIVSSPILDKNGNVTSAIEMVEDVTEKMRAKEEREVLQAQLQQTQKMQAIGTLAGGVAHDFNNILTPVIIQTELALLNATDDGPVRNSLQEVLEAGYRAKSLVKQILTFSRQSKTERTPLVVAPIVKEALKLLRSTLPTTIRLEKHIEEETGNVVADPTQIHQVLMNLCTNAAHAMRKTGGVLKVSLSEIVVDGDEAQQHQSIGPGRYVRLTVADTGHGIDPSLRERIFEPFFTTKDRAEGTGMGLSVVHGIVKSYDGSISVESGVDQGSTFTILLPSVESTEQSVSIQDEDLPPGNELVLVVDDEIAMVKALEAMLTQLGYTVISRTSSMEALEEFKAAPEDYSLVITDQTMPNMTGVELARALLQVREDLPIILCTGFSDLVDEEKAKQEGIKKFILKPIIMKDMARTMRTLLDE